LVVIDRPKEEAVGGDGGESVDFGVEISKGDGGEKDKGESQWVDLGFGVGEINIDKEGKEEANGEGGNKFGSDFANQHVGVEETVFDDGVGGKGGKNDGGDNAEILDVVVTGEGGDENVGGGAQKRGENNAENNVVELKTADTGETAIFLSKVVDGGDKAEEKVGDKKGVKRSVDG